MIRFNKAKYLVLFLGVLGLLIGITGFMIFQKTDGHVLDPDNFSSTPISDEAKISMKISLMKKSIREQNVENIDRLLGDDYQEVAKGKTVNKENLKSKLESKFQTRKKTKQLQMENHLVCDDPEYIAILQADQRTSTSDFEIVLSNIATKDNTIEADCVLQFFGEMKDGKLEKEEKIKIKFKKQLDEWKIAESDGIGSFFE